MLTGNKCTVVRNDELSLEQLKSLNPSRLIISPGPKTPFEAGICLDAIAYFHSKIPILGICLGHQALGVFFGAHLIKNPTPTHGKTSTIKTVSHPIFNNIEATFDAMRYHSLCLDITNVKPLKPIAIALNDNVLMAMEHVNYPCIGIQFHPESIGTKYGQKIIKNWSQIKF